MNAKRRKQETPRSTPRVGRGPAAAPRLSEALLELAEEWRSGITGAIASHCCVIDGPVPPSIDEQLDSLRVRLSPRFDELYRQAIAVAQARGHVDLVLQLLESLRRSIRQLDRWSRTSPVEAARALPGGSPWVASRQLAIEMTEHLSRLSPLIDDEVEPVAGSGVAPLTDMETEVWDLLKGNCLSAKQIGKKLAPQRSEDSVRKAIARIRIGGKRVETKRGQGYWRPDAGPRRD